MIRVAVLASLLILGGILAGCGSKDNSVEAPPKGEKPVTTTAPPGAKNPEERAREEQNAQAGDQDGGANK